jgi:hypothetical protein
MEIVSMSYVLGLLGLVSLVILGFLFVVYCHETGLKLNPKLSSEGWWRVVWSFLQSLWRSEKEIKELKREIERIIAFIKSGKYGGNGICSIVHEKLLKRFLRLYNTHEHWWKWRLDGITEKEAGRPRILYLEFLLKNVHLVHELLLLDEKIKSDESLSVSELDSKRHTFLYNYLHHSQIK